MNLRLKRAQMLRLAGASAPPVAEGQIIRRKIPDTREGIEFEVKRMKKYVEHYSGDGRIVRLARQLVERCPDGQTPGGRACEARKLYMALVKTTRFVFDPTRKEALTTPLLMLKDIQERGITSGDCDELATLFATMLSAIGHRPKFVFGGDNGWQHVWVSSVIKGRPTDFDLAEKLPIGKRVKFPRYGEALIW